MQTDRKYEWRFTLIKTIIIICKQAAVPGTTYISLMYSLGVATQK